MVWMDLVACIPASMLCSLSEKPFQGNASPTPMPCEPPSLDWWRWPPCRPAVQRMWWELYKIAHSMKDPVETCHPVLVQSLIQCFEALNWHLWPFTSQPTALLLTVVIYEGEVAVLSLQGKLELCVWWHYILVCCRDLYHHLQCERWEMIRVVWGWYPGVQGWV